MAAPTLDRDRTGTQGLRGIALLFLLSSVVFFPMTMNPLTFDYFDAASEADRLAHVDDNLGSLRLLFTGIGVAEVVLGVALWLWGRQVAEHTTGNRAQVATTFGWIGLAAGAIALLTRLTAWIDDAAGLASDDLSASDIVFGVAAGGGFSLTFVVFGYLMIRGAMPIWLGVVWIICGVMFWLGILPLWFFVAALVFGVRGLITFKDGTTALDRVSASSRRSE